MDGRVPVQTRRMRRNRSRSISSRAQRELGWHPRWRSAEAIERTAAWYRDHSGGTNATTLVKRDIKNSLT